MRSRTIFSIVATYAFIHVMISGTANANSPDPDAYYALSTKWRGEDQALDVFNGGGKDHLTHLAPRENRTGQRWRLTPAGRGYYRLTTKFAGPGMCLDVHNGDSRDNQPYLKPCANVTGQKWKLEPDGQWFRLKTEFRGDGMCLDIYNGGADDGQPYLKPCGDFSGQAWRLTKTSDAPQRADVGDTVTFRFPRHRDDPVDFCWSWATKDCGQRVADWWCKKQRFRGTADFKAGRAQGRTAFLGSKENCNDPGCTGFESLTCRGKLSSGVQGRKQVFANPIVSTERRLDFCLEFGKNCGAPVAEAFCKAEGFSRWVYFEGDEPGDPAKRTITLGSKQKCNGEGCVAMNIITCDD